MALQMFKELATEMTVPQAAFTARGNAVSALPHTSRPSQRFATNEPIYTSVDTRASTKPADPIQKLRKAERNGSVNIDNSGSGAIEIRNPLFEINDIYANDHDKKEAARAENNGYTVAELTRQNSFMYIESYQASSFFQTYSPTKPVSGYTIGASYVSADGQKSTRILDENGNTAYIDRFGSCTRYEGGLSSTTAPKVNDDLIDDSQKFNINWEFDKNGDKVKSSPEKADFKLAMTRIDNQYTKLPYQLDMIDRISAEVSGATTFKSSVPSGIKTDVKPSEPFASAVAATDVPAATKSIMFKDRAPAPWEDLKKPAVAAPAPAAPAFEPSV